MGTKIFVNQGLCSYYRVLWSKTKRFESMDKKNSFFISGGTVKIKIDENSKPLAIIHLDDLAINFVGVDFSPPPKVSQWRTNGCCVQLLYQILKFFGIFSVISFPLSSFCMFYQKVYHKLDYALSTFPHFLFSKSICMASLSLIEPVIK